MKLATLFFILLLIASVLGFLSPIPLHLPRLLHSSCEGFAEGAGIVIGISGLASIYATKKRRS
jgi:hypothetical protein